MSNFLKKLWQFVIFFLKNVPKILFEFCLIVSHYATVCESVSDKDSSRKKPT
jgi:hypothetical protein